MQVGCDGDIDQSLLQGVTTFELRILKNSRNSHMGRT